MIWYHGILSSFFFSVLLFASCNFSFCSYFSRTRYHIRLASLLAAYQEPINLLNGVCCPFPFTWPFPLSVVVAHIIHHSNRTWSLCQLFVSTNSRDLRVLQRYTESKAGVSTTRLKEGGGLVNESTEVTVATLCFAANLWLSSSTVLPCMHTWWLIGQRHPHSAWVIAIQTWLKSRSIFCS
jgi:hypothetical protein